MTHLIIGYGQIGKAIFQLFNGACKLDKGEVLEPVAKLDNGGSTEQQFDVVHICFPFSKDFIQQVIEYKNKYLKDKGILIIHSTVPVGISATVGAVHSPVRGKHPDLLEGIKTFVKYFGGKDAARAATFFEEVGISTKVTEKSENTEAMKLWDTTQYGWNILLEKAIYGWCKKKGLDFDLIYTHANKTYNEGYKGLDHPEFKKYVLEHKEGNIGGHCVTQNCLLLDHPITRQILMINKMLK